MSFLRLICSAQRRYCVQKLPGHVSSLLSCPRSAIPASKIVPSTDVAQRRSYKNFGHKKEPVPLAKKLWLVMIVSGIFLSVLDWGE